VLLGVPYLGSRFEQDRAAAGHRLPRVRDQVDEDLVELARVSLDQGHVPRQPGLEVDPFAHHVAQERRDRLHDVVEVDHPQLQHLPAPDRQQLPGERRRAFGCAHDRAYALPELHVLSELGQDQRGLTVNDREQVVEVVGDSAGQSADRVQPLALAQSQLLRTQPLLASPALADVGVEAHHRDDLAAVVAERGRRDADVDRRAVLAPAHTVGLAPRLAAEAQLDATHHLLAGLLRHVREETPDGLFLRPAEDPLGGGVPGLHATVPIPRQHRDRRACDERAQLLVGSAQPILRHAARGDVDHQPLQEDRPVRPRDHRAAAVQPDLPAVLSGDPVLLVEQLARRGCDKPCLELEQPRQVLRVD